MSRCFNPNCDRKYHYFERSQRAESNLAKVRRELEVPGKPQATTISTIRGLRETVRALMKAQEKHWAEEAHTKMFERTETEHDKLVQEVGKLFVEWIRTVKW